MATRHTVQQGECLTSIADHEGFFWESLWGHPENAQLRQLRRDPNVLLPGDELFIPSKVLKEVERQTEARHRFVRKGTPAKLKLRLLNDGGPRANVRYVLSVDGALEEGRTDDQGYLRVPIPARASQGRLVITGENNAREEYELLLGHLDPAAETRGLQQRLRNLGYSCPATGDLDEPTRQAIAAFRTAHDLTPGDAADDVLLAKLSEAHCS